MSHKGNHGYPITKQMQEERRERAENLQKEYSSLYPTTQDKLNALPASGSKKQRARLENLLATENKAKENELALKKVAEEKKEAKAVKAKKSR